MDVSVLMSTATSNGSYEEVSLMLFFLYARIILLMVSSLLMFLTSRSTQILFLHVRVSVKQSYFQPYCV